MSKIPKKGDPLTARECECVALAVRGYTRTEMAEELSISVPTVRNHLNRVFTKLNVCDRLQLALYAIHKGAGSLQRLDTEEAVERDRRSAERFPLSLSLGFSVASKRDPMISGNAQSINASSVGIMFTIPEGLPAIRPGCLMELLLDWPITLNAKCGLVLVMYGRMVRQDQTAIVLEIRRYFFKTKALLQQVQSVNC